VGVQYELDRCLVEVWPHRMLDGGSPRLADVQKWRRLISRDT
jgi:hypothetical protein